jgi:hypothetical protein
MPTFTGSGSSPDTAEVWLQWFCSSGFPTAQTIYQNYEQVSCTYGSMGSHGGCPGCVMSKFTIRKKVTPLPINGQCGSSNGGTFSSAPTTGLCNSGNPTAVTGVGPWYWSCTGVNGGSTSSCFANRAPDPINGQCGSSNGGSFVDAPTSGLCNSGTSSSVTLLLGTWRWTCSGLNGGSTSSCFATKLPDPINGLCGTAHNMTYAYNATGYAPYTQCSSGSPSSTLFPLPGMSAAWVCNGLNGGSNSGTCIAHRNNAPGNGVCGTAAKTYEAEDTAFTGTLCLIGTASPASPIFPVQGGTTNWLCNGTSGGTSASCIAQRKLNGVCGSSDGGTFASAPTANLCSAGTATAVTGVGPWTWSCTGLNGGTADSCSANKTPDPIDGTCGTAAKSYLSTDTAFAGTFCATGTAVPATPSFPTQGNTANWICQGSNGGSSITCSAPRALDGNCGSSDGSTVGTAPTTNLCSAGTATAVTGVGPWYWTCQGSNGGTTDSCSASKTPDPVNGVCGSSDGGTFTSAPTANLCSAGTATAVTGLGPWTWSCTGLNGGTADSCSANKTPDPIDGTCGTAAKSYLSTDTAFAGTFCATGTAVPATPSFPTQGNTANWICQGSNGGSSITCSAPRALDGNCGSSDGSTVGTAPTTNLCSAGTATAVTGVGPWYWTCQGSNGGTTDSCSASKTPDPVNGVCGSSDGGTFTSAPTANLCSAGTATAVTGLGPWTWSCTGLNGGTADSCSAVKVTNGQCGSSNGGTFTIAPTTNLCTVGTPTSASWNGYNWAWACQSCDGGATDFCYAYRPTTEVCGPSNGGTFDTTPTTNLCSIGIASAVSGTGPWYWTCHNNQGLVVGSCSANKTVAPLSIKSNKNVCECDSDQISIRSSAMEYFANLSSPSNISNPIVRTVGARELNPGQSIILRSVVSDITGSKLTYYWSCTGGTISNVHELSPRYTAHVGANILKDNICTLVVKNSNGGITVRTVSIKIR